MAEVNRRSLTYINFLPTHAKNEVLRPKLEEDLKALLVAEGSRRVDLKPKRDKFMSLIEKLEKNYLEAQND